MKNYFTTHIGSLPHTSIQEALDYTFKFDIPCLFTLPCVNDDDLMGKDIISMLNIGDPETMELSLRYSKSSEILSPRYFEEFMSRLKHSRKETFKYQLIDPITFYKILKNKGELSIRDLSEFLLKKYTEMLLSFEHPEMLFYLDAPMICEDTSELALINSFMQQLKSETKLKLGLHLCQRLDVSFLSKIKVDILHLDADLYTNEELSEVEKYINSPYLAPSCGLVGKSLAQCNIIYLELEGLKKLMNSNV